MRRILIDDVRRKRTQKRGGAWRRQPLEAVVAPEPDEELLALDEALQKLAAIDPKKAKLVELRYFAGLTGEQAAEVLGISPTTADRHWTYARVWPGRRRSRRYRIVFAALALAMSSATPARAGSLVTFQFSGVIADSSSSVVHGGDPFSGTFTYDLDAPNQASPLPFPVVPNPPAGLHEFVLPKDSPVGMTFTVGPISYSTQTSLNASVTNDDPLLGDSLDVDSDEGVGGIVPPHASGDIFIQDLILTALSSLRPPATLDLGAFGDSREFSGIDGTRGGSFDGVIVTLGGVPEPDRWP
jgi:hypothetical protein